MHEYKNFNWVAWPTGHPLFLGFTWRHNFTGANSKSMHSHRREIVFHCMCWPCVWQQICAISWDFFTPVQHNHQYILGWPPLRLTAKYPSETQEYCDMVKVALPARAISSCRCDRFTKQYILCHYNYEQSFCNGNWTLLRLSKTGNAKNETIKMKQLKQT